MVVLSECVSVWMYSSYIDNRALIPIVVTINREGQGSRSFFHFFLGQTLVQTVPRLGFFRNSELVPSVSHQKPF